MPEITTVYYKCTYDYTNPRSNQTSYNVDSSMTTNETQLAEWYNRMVNDPNGRFVNVLRWEATVHPGEELVWVEYTPGA